MSFWDAVTVLPPLQILFFALALVVAFGFEFVNGFHDTANAVTTVIYTRSLSPTVAVLYSGFMNFLGALGVFALLVGLFGVVVDRNGVAFGIVNLLPVDLLVTADPTAGLVMVLALLIAGIVWNLGTWYYGIPVSSSHTLIGSILGVGLMHSLLSGNGVQGINWGKATDTGLALLLSPLSGFLLAAVLLLALKRVLKQPRLYVPPTDDPNDKPPLWVRASLIVTCGGVSLAHGSNDGQKGMGLILLVLIGFLPAHYALHTDEPERAAQVAAAVAKIADTVGPPAAGETTGLKAEAAAAKAMLDGRATFADLPRDERWAARQRLLKVAAGIKKDPELSKTLAAERKMITGVVEFVPLWVVIGVAVALGVGTTVGYKRIVITVAEKIGKSHLTYAQGAVAELVTAGVIFGADYIHAPVSTTQVLNSAVAGTMAANKSGVQMGTIRKILLAWVLTLPCTMVLAALLYSAGRMIVK